jgi:hypothetical protein
MKYIKTYENHNNTTLIIVDVQKSFKKFFTEMYLNELKKYCQNFQNVYQIFDNHVDGKNVDKDYLYDENPKLPTNGDIYTFPNQKLLVEKRYTYQVNCDFFKKILDEKVYNDIKKLEGTNKIKRGQSFKTNEGTSIVYIGNNHKWMHLGKKLLNLFELLRGKDVIIVGGADGECLEDIVISAESFGVKVKRDHKYIYSASHCPIK